MTVQVFNSFARVPLDEPGLDHDDNVVGPHERTKADQVSTSRALFSVGDKPPGDYAIVVPFPGVIHEHDRGDVVYGIKRIVHRMTHTLPTLTAASPAQKRLWGSFFTEKLKRAQGRAGLRVTGVWDLPTHKRFAPWADQLALALMQGTPITDVERRRRDVLAFLMAFYNRRWAIPYSQLRPTELKPVKKIKRADCSGSVATGMWTADVFPQVDWRWTNTDTQILFGSPVFQLKQVELADVVFYGRGTDPSHEACVVDAGDDGAGVRVFSFGHFPAKILPIDYRPDRIAIRRFI